MKCPYCFDSFSDTQVREQSAGSDIADNRKWTLLIRNCPTCQHLILELVEMDGAGQIPNKTYLVKPRGSTRPTCHRAVPNEFAEDYNEACMVLNDSPKASAALSRRCLQHILREQTKVKPSDLYNEIEAAITSKLLPDRLAELLHMARVIGNFAAHPMKSQSSGAVLPVEPGEAEFNLDLLEELFEFYFVQPQRIAERKAALNVKLSEAGKPILP